MNKKLAKVKDAGTEMIKGHVLSFIITVEYEDGSGERYVGAMHLEKKKKKKKKRVGTAYGCEMIRRVLQQFEIDDLSQLKDKIVWVYGTGEGCTFEPDGIGRLKVNGGEKPLIFADVYKDMVEDAK